MKKITHTIVNDKMQLVGFRITGKASDFGEFGDAEVTKHFDIEHMCMGNFNNRQVACSKNGMVFKGSFKLQKLPMLIVSGDGFIPFDNTITLKTRYVYDNRNVGFEVLFANGYTARFTTENVIKLCGTYEPTNFVVRTVNGKMYVAGKPGMPLENLPEINLGNAASSKSKKSGAVEIGAVGTVGSVKIKNYDIVTLFKWMREHRATIVNLSGTKYEATGDTISSADERFKVLPYGEVGSSYLEYNDTKLNASCRFKVPGTVLIGGAEGFLAMSGSSEITFIYRTKNLFNNGKCRLERVGAIVSEADVAELKDKFGKSVAVVEVTDENVLKTVGTLFYMVGKKLFEIDIKNLELMSKDTANSYLLGAKDIFDLTTRKERDKVYNYIYKSEIDNLVKAGFRAPAEEKKVIAKYAGKSEAELKALEEAGIDVYTGAFVADGEQRANTSAVNDAIEIAYSIDGFNPSNYTGAKLAKAIQDAAAGKKELPDFIYNELKKVHSVANSDAKLQSMYKALDSVKADLADVKEKLWMHKVASWILSNKQAIHTHDAGNWDEVQNNRARTNTYYQCNVPGCDTLRIAVKNIKVGK